MKCPVCSIDLTISERQGIEIDYCPKCRGVWLDRGELNKIIERSDSISFEARGKHEHYEHKKHKRKSFFGELFD
jgi:hypothetical protein